MQPYFKELKRFWKFTGRTQLGDFWALVGINVLVLTIVALPLIAIDSLKESFAMAGYGFLVFILLVPILAAAARRLHDTGRSAWWLVFWFIPPQWGATILYAPQIGALAVFVFLLLEGQKGDNEYGPTPT